MDYFPAKGEWTRRPPAELGVAPQALAAALDFAAANPIDAPEDLAEILPKGQRHPSDRPLGPLKRRGPTSGLVVKDGYIVGQFGPVGDVQVTFSATKSYISATAGLAFDRGLIASLDEPVRDRVADGGFEAPQNRSITWRQLLQLTSEWEGELFGIPEWIDRGREVGATPSGGGAEVVGGSAAKPGPYRQLQPPGSFWEYNDVRVNRVALALLRVFGQPLPQVLMEGVMDPIDASSDWQWHGYETSWVEVGGRRVQSVSGGAHWGGGLWISSYDHARFGLLYLNRGRWRERQLLSEEWIEASVAPCSLKPEYGLLWWLNHGGDMSKMAGEDSFAARGAGGNIVFVEPGRRLVIVLRWCGDIKGVVDRVVASCDA